MADTLEFWDRHNLPWADPKRSLDYSMARLRKTAARKLLAELAARGIVLSVRDGKLCRNREAVIVNGTAQRIEFWREWFIEVLQEMPEK